MGLNIQSVHSQTLINIQFTGPFTTFCFRVRLVFVSHTSRVQNTTAYQVVKLVFIGPSKDGDVGWTKTQLLTNEEGNNIIKLKDNLIHASSSLYRLGIWLDLCENPTELLKILLNLNLKKIK